MRYLCSLHVSRIHCHAELQFSSNVYQTNWFILSVLFLTGSETSVVLHMSRIPCYMDLHPGRNVYLTSWFILSLLFLTGGETSVVLHMSNIPCYMDLHPGRNVYPTSWFILSVVFNMWLDICGPCNHPGSLFTQTSNLVGMSSLPAGSFCLCCF